MILHNQNYVILTPISEGGIEELKRIERVARTCYKSEDKITEDGESAKKIVANLIRNGHEAMLEHVDITVCFTTDRGISHEIVRHRLCSFAQESTRYCNYSKDKFDNRVHFIDPYEAECLSKKWNDLPTDIRTAAHCEMIDAFAAAEEHYLNLMKMDIPPEIARAVLPNGLKTEINVTANLREWRHIFKLRLNEAAHPQIRKLLLPLLFEFQLRIPIVFNDISYTEKGHIPRQGEKDAER